jgi:FkbM family methyltransferase
MSQSPSIFVSYSTNRENVILNRLFGAQEQGFYVDVGAGHPRYGNDTWTLYVRGWRGINIEPTETMYRELIVQRPEDRTFNVVISDDPGTVTFYEVMGTRLSTCDQKEAKRASEKGFEVVQRAMEAVTLRSLFSEASLQEIDLLKVDVEGFEFKILASSDWDRFRPKVIMVKAMFLKTRLRRPDIITPFLAAQGYRHVYFDGLNDFYLERNYETTPDVFKTPINVFDNFESIVPHELVRERVSALVKIASLESRLVEKDKEMRRVARIAEASIGDLQRARTELQAMHARGRELAAQLESMANEVQQARDQLQRMHHSSSWRITRPLRLLRHPKRTLRILRDRLR